MPTLKTEDAELFYEDTGPGEPILFLHGLGGSTADWAPQVAALAPSYRVLVLDARGSGRSRDLQHPAGPFSVKQFAHDAARVLDHLGAVPAHIVGLSMGGMIAFQLAVDNPRCVRTLTIVNSRPALVPRTMTERLAFALRLSVARLFGPAGMARLLARRLYPRPEQAHLRRQFLESMARNEKWAYIASQRALVGWSVIDRVGTIEAPALVVASERDYWPVADKEAYARLMKRAEVVVVAGTGHALPIEAPEQFNCVLTAFLDRQRSGHQEDSPRPNVIGLAVNPGSSLAARPKASAHSAGSEAFDRR